MQMRKKNRQFATLIYSNNKRTYTHKNITISLNDSKKKTIMFEGRNRAQKNVYNIIARTNVKLLLD